MTPEENHLWYDFLKSLPFPVKRQRPMGRYIADFFIPIVKIVIELDGSQHYEEVQFRYDRKRDAYMESRGIKVLRFLNADVQIHFPEVCDAISQVIEERLNKK